MSPRLRVTALLMAFVFVLVGYWVYQARIVTMDPILTKAEHPTPAPSTSASPKITEDDTAPVLSQPRSITVANPPSVAAIRKEAEKNVHITPPSLMKFSIEIGQRMDGAKESEPKAQALMNDLGTCVHPSNAADLENSPVQARALCIVTAQELANRWPKLAAQSAEIVKISDPSALRLARMLNVSTPR